MNEWGGSGAESLVRTIHSYIYPCRQIEAQAAFRHARRESEELKKTAAYQCIAEVRMCVRPLALPSLSLYPSTHPPQQPTVLWLSSVNHGRINQATNPIALLSFHPPTYPHILPPVQQPTAVWLYSINDGRINQATNPAYSRFFRDANEHFDDFCQR